MATRSEENRRKQQQLVNAGYKGVVVDGSWGPYQQKLYLHYLANSLGPTKQQKVNTAKQNNQREAQIAKNYFSQTPSVGNLARGVYHWWNSVPALGGQNESGVQEYNVASNPVVAAAGPTKFDPKAIAEGWKAAGSFMNKLKYLSNLYLPSAKNAPVPTKASKAAEAATTTTKRLRGVDNLKAAYNTQSANLSEAEKQIETLTAANRQLQQELRGRSIAEWRNSRPNGNFKPNYNALTKKAQDRANEKFSRALDQLNVDKAKKIASETPTQPANNVKVVENSKVQPEVIETQQAGTPKASNPETSSVNNGTPSNNSTTQNSSKKGFNWGYYLGFGSFKPEGGFGNKASTTGKWILNATKLGGAYHVPAYIYDSHVQNKRRAEAEAQGKEYIETPTLAWDISPMGIMQNIIKSDIKQGQKYYKQNTKAPVEDDWLKQLDEAGKNVGY